MAARHNGLGAAQDLTSDSDSESNSDDTYDTDSEFDSWPREENDLETEPEFDLEEYRVRLEPTPDFAKIPFKTQRRGIRNHLCVRRLVPAYHMKHLQWMKRKRKALAIAGRALAAEENATRQHEARMKLANVRSPRKAKSLGRLSRAQAVKKLSTQQRHAADKVAATQGKARSNGTTASENKANTDDNHQAAVKLAAEAKAAGLRANRALAAHARAAKQADLYAKKEKNLQARLRITNQHVVTLERFWRLARAEEADRLRAVDEARNQPPPNQIQQPLSRNAPRRSKRIAKK